jgi:hypothetical protein
MLVDPETIRRAQAGDAQAFNEIVHAYKTAFWARSTA